MARTQAVHYRSDDGSEPVNDFIDGLDVRKQAAIDLQIDRLNDQPPSAPPVPFPHSSQVRGPLRELRCHYGPELYRVLYRRSGNLVLLLHMMRKDTGKLPEADITTAEERWLDFKQRMDAERRRPPRAAGRIVIARRQTLGLTQQELAERVGTSHSVISRIESGQHPTSVTTLRRLANAFETHLVVGFSDEPEALAEHELVAVS